MNRDRHPDEGRIMYRIKTGPSAGTLCSPMPILPERTGHETFDAARKGDKLQVQTFVTTSEGLWGSIDLEVKKSNLQRVHCVVTEAWEPY